LALNEFGLQVRKIVVIQVELALECAIRQAPTALQEGNRLIEELLKGHRCPSTGCEACQGYKSGSIDTFYAHLYCKGPAKESRKYGARDAEETPRSL
jgi:hypothetical protein